MTGFTVSGGMILDPNGNKFVPRGINVEWSQLSTIAATITTIFPGINFLRVNYQNSAFSDTPASIATYVTMITSQGIVVCFEDHTGTNVAPYTGATLTAEQAWYSACATYWASNPWVWYGTFNSPGGLTNLAAITTQQVTTYSTIRTAGANCPILMELPNGGVAGMVGEYGEGTGNTGPMTQASYTTMSTIVWDFHCYGSLSSYSTDQSVVSSELTGGVTLAAGYLGAQSFLSADGVVPVIIGEWGNSSNGSTLDANALQVLSAVTSCGLGWAAFAYDPDDCGNQLVTDCGTLCAYGMQVAALIGQATPQSTVAQITTATGGSIDDLFGNIWTLTTTGTVHQNFTAVSGGTGMESVTFKAGTIYAESTTSSWFNYNGSGFTASSAPALPASPIPNMMTNNNAGTLTSAGGSHFTLSNTGTIYKNGSALGGSGTTNGTNVRSIALIGNVVYSQDNSSGAWSLFESSGSTWVASARPTGMVSG